MLWDELSAAEFENWVGTSGGVCVLPIGVLEKHGDHLPLGTDMYIATAVSKKAAEQSSVVMFPYYFLGQIAEGRHVKGALAGSHRLIMDALLEMCDEMARNGFKKIVLLSAHGGNWAFLPFFTQQFPGLNRSYAVYTYYINDLREEQRKLILSNSGEDAMGDHAGFLETSLMMHIRPDLVHIEKQNAAEWVNLGRLKTLEEAGVFSGFNWYSKYPHHFAGDPSRASAVYGETIFDMMVSNVTNVINAIKADTTSAALIKEYNGKAN